MTRTTAARDEAFPGSQPGSQSVPEPFATDESEASAHLPPASPSRRWRLFDRLVLGAFVVGLLAPATIMLVGLRPAAIENRPLVQAPRLSAGALLDASWPKGIDAFLADNVYFRPYAVRLRGEVTWLSGGSGTPDVIRGKDGWLFLRGELDPKCLFTATNQALALRREAAKFAATGQVFRFVGVPDKHAIYPEQLAANPFPPACSETGRAAIRETIAALGPQAVDGWTALDDARAAATRPTDETGLYFRQDSHWTPRGATAAVGALVRSIDPALWDDADVVETGTVSESMDLPRLMGIRRNERVTDVRIRPGVKLSQQDVPVPVEIQNARSVFRVTASGDRPTIPGRTIVIYDSFFGIDVDLVAPFFADTTWVHVGDALHHPELAGLLGPFDTVIFDRVERGLYETDVDAVLAPFVR